MVIDDTWKLLQSRVKQLLTHASEAEKMLKDYEERLRTIRAGQYL
jgi:hypothetical protein